MDDMDYSILLAHARRLRASLIAAKESAEEWLDESRGATFDQFCDIGEGAWWVEANAALKATEGL